MLGISIGLQLSLSALRKTWTYYFGSIKAYIAIKKLYESNESYLLGVIASNTGKQFYKSELTSAHVTRLIACGVVHQPSGTQRLVAGPYFVRAFYDMCVDTTNVKDEINSMIRPETHTATMAAKAYPLMKTFYSWVAL